MSTDPTAKYLAAYPPELRAQVRVLIAEGRLAGSLQRRYPERHDITSDAIAAIPLALRPGSRSAAQGQTPESVEHCDRRDLARHGGGARP